MYLRYKSLLHNIGFLTTAPDPCIKDKKIFKIVYSLSSLFIA